MLNFLKPYKWFLVGVVLVSVWVFIQNGIDAYGNRKFGEGYARAVAEQTTVAAKQQKKTDATDNANEDTTRNVEHQAIKAEAVLTDRERSLTTNPAAKPIRLCNSTAPPGGSVVSSVPGSAYDVTEAPAENRHADQVGDDLRARLVEYGAEAERLRQQVTLWQLWYENSKENFERFSNDSIREQPDRSN